MELSLTGVSRTREAWLEFLDNLIADPRFAKPSPRSEDVEDQGYGFTLMVTYLPQEVPS